MTKWVNKFLTYSPSGHLCSPRTRSEAGRPAATTGNAEVCIVSVLRLSFVRFASSSSACSAHFPFHFPPHCRRCVHHFPRTCCGVVFLCLCRPFSPSTTTSAFVLLSALKRRKRCRGRGACNRELVVTFSTKRCATYATVRCICFCFFCNLFPLASF